MLEQLVRNWWALVLRGVLAILFGILAFIWPGITATVLVYLFGAYVLLDGIFAVIGAFRQAGERAGWWVLLLEGLAGIGVGILAFIWPGVTATVLVFFIAAWAILTGIFEILAAIRLRREIEGEWLMVLAGLLSVLFGILIFIWPAAGIQAVIWLIGGYAILFGLLLIFLGLRLRGMRGELGLG